MPGSAFPLFLFFLATFASIGSCSAAPDKGGAAAPTIAGVASVIDGDTIEIHGKRIRLHAIDAPEGAQTCRDAEGALWRCGQKAAFALDALVKGATISCTQVDTDRYKRMVAVCTAGGVDIAGALVREGLAIAYTKYGDQYVKDEQAAHKRKAGIWAGVFIAPKDWRDGVRW